MVRVPPPRQQMVRASGLEWTVLRPSAFASNTLTWAQAVREGAPAPNMMGDGDRASSTRGMCPRLPWPRCSTRGMRDTRTP